MSTNRAGTHWYVLGSDGVEYGPYSSSQLKHFAKEGRVVADTSVRKYGMETYVRADAIKNLIIQLPPVVDIGLGDLPEVQVVSVPTPIPAVVQNNVEEVASKNNSTVWISVSAIAFVLLLASGISVVAIRASAKAKELQAAKIAEAKAADIERAAITAKEKSDNEKRERERLERLSEERKSWALSKREAWDRNGVLLEKVRELILKAEKKDAALNATNLFKDSFLAHKQCWEEFNNTIAAVKDSDGWGSAECQSRFSEVEKNLFSHEVTANATIASIEKMMNDWDVKYSTKLRALAELKSEHKKHREAYQDLVDLAREKSKISSEHKRMCEGKLSMLNRYASEIVSLGNTIDTLESNMTWRDDDWLRYRDKKVNGVTYNILGSGLLYAISYVEEMKGF